MGQCFDGEYLVTLPDNFFYSHMIQVVISDKGWSYVPLICYENDTLSYVVFLPKTPTLVQPWQKHKTNTNWGTLQNYLTSNLQNYQIIKNKV